MHICYLTKMIVLIDEMLQLLLTHGVEKISGDVRHCNDQVANQSSHMSIDYKKFLFRE
jgi:hypothetical protein